MASGSSLPTSTSTASSCRSFAPEAATITGSTTSGTGWSARKLATVSMIRREKSIPVLAASTPMSSNTTSSSSRMNSGGASWTERTSVVDCAVSATTALMP